MITSPNIKNIHHNIHYKFLKKNFNEKHFRYYGVQLDSIKDSQVVGTLPRGELLNRFQSAAGYLYTHNDPWVCYLPPIEMMVVGGPVLFMKGSLLDDFFHKNAPFDRRITY